MIYEPHNRLKEPERAKFFTAVMTGPSGCSLDYEKELEGYFGPIELRSPVYDFSAWTPYYDPEMGHPVSKHFLVFQQLRPMDELRAAKLLVEQVQHRYSSTADNRCARRVNLDPGYLTGWSLVLATVKNNAHRIYLGEGIFAEITLLFRDGAFTALPWTYPDYASATIREFFNGVRTLYMRQLR